MAIQEEAVGSIPRLPFRCILPRTANQTTTAKAFLSLLIDSSTRRDHPPVFRTALLRQTFRKFINRFVQADNERLDRLSRRIGEGGGVEAWQVGRCERHVAAAPTIALIQSFERRRPPSSIELTAPCRLYPRGRCMHVMKLRPAHTHCESIPLRSKKVGEPQVVRERVTLPRVPRPRHPPAPNALQGDGVPPFWARSRARACAYRRNGSLLFRCTTTIAIGPCRRRCDRGALGRRGRL